jgi:glycosyltransferase involved in cell wall biosynthesis
MNITIKKKILFVITKSNWGGAQRYVFDLATNLPKDKFEISVAYGHPGLLAQKLGTARIKTYPIASLERDISAIADVKSFFELLRLFRTEKFDVVHLNSSKAAGVGALAARLAGISRIIFTVHGWPFLEQRNFISRCLIYFFSWLTAILSHKVIAVSSHDLSVAKKMSFVGCKTIRIYNGIDQNMQFDSVDEIRSAFPVGVRITGTIGELTKNKNQIALIDQAKNDQNMYVAIVGEGEDRAYLETKIREYGLSERVKLFGFMPATKVLRSFDVFALPSLKEGLPYVLLEAKATGLPVVANRVGGVGEVLDVKDMSEFSLEQMVQKTIELY